jgi:hypothetical protein
MKDILDYINELIEKYPYKQPGNRDSYSDYNQGWSDACELIKQEILNNLHKLSISNEGNACNHDFVPKKCWVHKCSKCGELHVEYIN